MGAPITRQHKALADALEGYRERHGDHPALKGMEAHLESHGGGYNQGKIADNDVAQTPGQQAANRVRESSATRGKGDERNPNIPEPHTQGNQAPGVPQNRERKINIEQTDVARPHPRDRTGQDDAARSHPSQTGQAGLQNARNPRGKSSGENEPFSSRFRGVKDGNTGEQEREAFNDNTDEQRKTRAKGRFGR